MLNLREIHKPRSIQEALQLLRQPDTVAMAGGTGLLASQRRDVRAVVDLSGLGLAYIREHADGGGIAIGATTRLAEVVDSPILRAAANGVVAQAAHRSATNLLRNQATVAGTLISDPDGVLAVALIALDTQIVCTGAEGEQVSLADFLRMRDHFLMCGIVTQVVIPAGSMNRRAALETVARTPRDRPIVSVCAALEFQDNTIRAAAIALGGIGEVALRSTAAEEKLIGTEVSSAPVEEAARATGDIQVAVSDFRGSADYRRELAQVLTARALRQFLASRSLRTEGE